MGQRGRPRKNPVTQSDSGMNDDITPADITEKNYPAGVPQNPDGSVADESMITMEEAQRIGAVSPESAQYNRDMAKRIDAKTKPGGEKNIKWGEPNALHMYDVIRKAFPSTSIVIYVHQDEPMTFDHRPFPMTNVRSGSDMYDYILRNCHKFSPAGHYLVRFKTTGGNEVGRGHLRMPDTQGDAPMNGMGNHMQMPTYPPVMGQFGAFGQPQGVMLSNRGQPMATGYQQPQQQQITAHPPMMPYGIGVHGPPPPSEYPPEVNPDHSKAAFEARVREAVATQVQAHQNAQAPQQQVQQAPPPYVYPAQDPRALQYQPAPPPPQSGYDSQMAGAVASMYQEMQRTQQLIHQNQIQLAQALGTIEELKRASHVGLGAPSYMGIPATPVASPAPTPPAAPPPMAAPTQGAFQGPPPGYYQQHQQQQYPQYMQHQQHQSPPDVMSQITQATQVLAGMTRAVHSIREAVGVNPNGMMDESGGFEDMPVPAQAPESPFQVMPLGVGPNAPAAAINKDGSVHWAATLVGLAPKVIDGMKSMVDSLAQQEQLRMQMAQQAQGGPAPQPQQLQQVAPMLPLPQSHPQQHLIPDMGAFRNANGM